MPITDLRAHFAAGGKAVNGWCAIPSVVTAEIMARQGFDLMTVDLQHGLIDYQMARIREQLEVLKSAKPSNNQQRRRSGWSRD